MEQHSQQCCELELCGAVMLKRTGEPSFLKAHADIFECDTFGAFCASKLQKMTSCLSKMLFLSV